MKKTAKPPPKGPAPRTVTDSTPPSRLRYIMPWIVVPLVAALVVFVVQAGDDTYPDREAKVKQWCSYLGYTYVSFTCLGLDCSVRVKEVRGPIAIQCGDTWAGCKQVK